MALSAALLTKSQKDTYVPRAENELQIIFERHFDEFCAQYEEGFAKRYGMFRLERIQEVGTRFRGCGDYLQGIARIRCTNPDCGHDYFRPFSCKGFYLCPSCSQKRTLLFAEQLTEKVLLDLPRRILADDCSFLPFRRLCEFSSVMTDGYSRIFSDSFSI